MSYHVTSFEATPNPNAVKCWLDRPISQGPRSFRSAGEARSDPIARALFDEVGATTVLFNGDWLTVNKRPDAEWPGVRAQIKRVLSAAG